MGAKRIPIKAAEKIADEYDQNQVVLVTFDRSTGTTHVVTYGRTVEECEQAAAGGNFVKKALGWPESLCKAKPARARKRRPLGAVCTTCGLSKIDCASWGQDTDSHRRKA